MAVVSAAVTVGGAPAAGVGAVSGGSVRMLGEYEMMEKLGSGLQGKVYKARCAGDGRLYALKLIDQTAVRASAKVWTNLQREIAAMERVTGHPNVIRVKEVAYDVEKPRKKRPGQVRKCIMIVMELAPHGELFDYLMLSKFSEPLARAYFRQILEALHHCHGKEVAHRDIKPENLLLDGDFGLRVADWGLSAVLDDLDSVMLRTQCGTHAYMAPEVLRREAYSGKAADVWSAGVVLFIMLAGFPPFEKAAAGDWWYDRVAHNQHSLFWQAHERSAAFSAGAKDLINAIFVAAPARRITVDDALKHPWLTGETPSPAALKAEMHERRVKIAQSKGLPLPGAEEGAVAMEDVDMGTGDVFGSGVVVRSGDDDALPARNPSLLARTAVAKAGDGDVSAALAARVLPRLAVPADARLEALPADFDGSDRISWFAIKTDASPATVARSVALYFETARSAGLTLRGGADAVKLRAAVPGKAGTVQVDTRVFSVPAAVAGTRGIPADATHVITVQRVTGDTLAINAIFTGLQRAYGEVLAGGAAVASESASGSGEEGASGGAGAAGVSIADTVTDALGLV